MSVAPTLPAACGSLPPEGVLRLRPGEEWPPRSPLCVVRCPPRGRCACGPAKPVPRPWLAADARLRSEHA
jgi:hypothetical protein